MIELEDIIVVIILIFFFPDIKVTTDFKNYVRRVIGVVSFNIELARDSGLLRTSFKAHFELLLTTKQGDKVLHLVRLIS